MKRLLVFIVASLLLTQIGICETISFKELSIEELVALRSEINSEIASRLLSNDSSLFPGVYVVGEDLEFGSYMITLLEEDENHISNVTLFSSYDGYLEYSPYDYTTARYVLMEMEDIKQGFISYLRLYEKQVLIVGAGTYSIMKVKK